MTGPSRKGDLALLGAAFFYGTTFVVVQDAVDEAAPTAFLAARFGVASLALAPFALARRRRSATPHLWRDSALAAVTMAAGYMFQTVGLQYTTSSRSAFITYLLVVMVPVMASLTIRRVPTHRVMVAVAVAAVGLFLLTDVSGGGFGRGELLTLACAVGFAANVVVIAAVIERHDALVLTFVQLAMLTLFFVIPGQVQGGYGFETSTWLAVAFTGVFASAVAFSLQNWGQRTVGPSRAAILLVMEPVFAAGIDFLDGERLGVAGVAGAVLIIAAVLISELGPTDTEPLSSAQSVQTTP